MADINVDLGDIRGLRGYTGVRGSQWFTGTAITHTTGSDTPNTGIADARAGDMYLNTETSNVYQCTTGGASGVAVWAFLQNIKGANGNGSLVASTATDGYTDVTFTDAEGEETTFRAGNTRATATSTLATVWDSSTSAIVESKVCEARGDVVCVNLYARNVSFSAATAGAPDNVLAQLPEGFRPKLTQRLPASYYVSSRGWVPAIVDVETDGRIQTRACSATSGTVTTVLICFSFMRA